MKAIRSTLYFGISLIFFGACLNPPEFDNSPLIAFESISFERGSVGIRDSLKVTISFKDGDGDLGQAVDSTSPPNHQLDFFANNNGQLLAIPGELVPSFAGYRFRNSRKTPKEASYYVEPPNSQTGELITLASEGFSLPPFESPYDCAANDESYLNEKPGPDTIYVYKEFKHIIKDKSTIVDSLERMDNPNIYYYAVVDYFYLKTNPAFYNIKVEFFIKNSDQSYTEYDWRKESCATFDGRFPILTQRERPLEGVLTYAMTSVGFLTTFGSKTLKLKITVFDRALNSSNTVETGDFSLDEI